MILQTNKTLIPIHRSDVPLTDSDIIKRYIGISKFPCTIISPLRDDDDHPSFSFFERGGHIYWKDFGTGNGGTTIELLQKLWYSTYTETLLKLKMDIATSTLPKTNLLRLYKGTIHLVSGSTIKVQIRKWRDWDIEFWNSYGITKEFATWCKVYPISHCFFTRKINNKEETITVPMDKYAYAYFEWKDGNETIKVYQPFSTRMKWLSKHDSSVWDLWKQVFLFAENKSNDEVIITSSRKDAMCLWCNLGVPALSMQGEGYLPKPQVMQQIFNKFKYVYLWYDNDFKHIGNNPGQDNAMKLIAMYPKLYNICIPTELQCKDPSDLVKNLGKQELIKLWNLKKHA